jgi:hypothetical protein
MTMPTFPYRLGRKRIRKALGATVDALPTHIEERSGRRPTDEELAATLPMSVVQIRRARTKSGVIKEATICAEENRGSVLDRGES